jgi:uncharacterized zinc-type alcohol dehydrogenase-like protein
MKRVFQGYAAARKGEPLRRIEFDPGELGADQVEVAVEYCGICHSDLSMLDNEWGMTRYPIVPGHEIVGTVVAVGAQVRNLQVGQRVGIGWSSASCLACRHCLAGDHNLCPSGEGVMVGRHGGFADRVRVQWLWAIPLPETLDASKAGPLFCGGITVFNPLVQAQVKPTERAGVVGIGGLGHLALRFLNKWGCEVFAFTSTDAKRQEALRLGAHHVIPSRDAEQIKKLAGALDFLLVTVNVPLDWKALLGTLGPRGRLHFVGAVLEPVPVEVFDLITAQRVLSGSPIGSPATMRTMLDFCARHGILPVTETFPMSQVNDALAHLRAGKARYRIVLRSDF